MRKLVSDQTSVFILLEECDPFPSLTPLDTFSVFFFLFFSCYMFMLSQNRVLKRNGTFHCWSPFQLSSFACQEEKLMQSSSKHQSWVPAWKEWTQTGRDGWSIGRATLTNVWHHLTYWMAFLCQDTERVGGREAACFRLHSEQTRSLCRHTPPHTSLNCARKQINKPRLTSHTLHQVEKLTNHKMYFKNKEKLVRLNLQNNVDNCKGCSLGLLQRAMKRWDSSKTAALAVENPFDQAKPTGPVTETAAMCLWASQERRYIWNDITDYPDADEESSA